MHSISSVLLPALVLLSSHTADQNAECIWVQELFLKENPLCFIKAEVECNKYNL